MGSIHAALVGKGVSQSALFVSKNQAIAILPAVSL